MARYYVIQFDELYLTDSGTNTGLPCKIIVTGDDAFNDTDGVRMVKGADGAPNYLRRDRNLKGIDIEIELSSVTQTQMDLITAKFNATRDNDPTHFVRVVATSPKYNFDVKAKGQGGNYISKGNFIGNIINNFKLRLVTTGAGS